MIDHGQEAIDYLSGLGRYGDRGAFPFPRLVLLDLKMPVLDGFGLLRWIRKESQCKDLTVVVFSSSYQHSDVSRGYIEGATAFLTKPALLDDLVRVARALNRGLIGDGFDVSALAGLAQFRRP